MSVQNPGDGINVNSTNTNTNGSTQVPPNSTPFLGGVAGILNAFGGDAQSTIVDGEVSKVATVIREFFDNAEKGQTLSGFRTLTLSAATTGNFGSVIVANRILVNGKVKIYAYTLIIEKSKAVPLDITVVNLGNGMQADVFVGAADAFTQTYKAKVVDEVSRGFGVGAEDVILAGWTVIYDITPVDADNIVRLLSEVLKSIDTTRDITTRERQSFNLGMLTNPASPIFVRSQMDLDRTVVSPNGLPVRSDIRSELIFTERNRTDTPVPEASEAAVCATSAYVDLIYTPPVQPWGGAPVPSNQPYYIPRIVITNFELKLPYSALEFMLLGIASMAALARQRAYGFVWRNQFGTNQNKKRYFGAVGLQVPFLTPDNQPNILDVSDGLTLYRLMETTLAPSPVFTLEIAQGGQSNQVSSIFAKIAKGDVRAQKRLFQAADNLTLGKFSAVFAQLSQVAGAQQIVTTDEVPSYLGYYTEDGEQRDIRELDLLAVLNTVGLKDPETVENFLTTLASPEPYPIRLARRARLLQNIAKDVRIKGYTHKFDFGATFIEALTQSINECGLTISNDAMFRNNEQVYNQTAQQWQHSMVNGQMISPLFTQAAQNNPAQFNVGNIYGAY
jgi:hypothetical protein